MLWVFVPKRLFHVPELFQMSNYNSLTENERHEFECLQAQLSVETPMRPLNGFQLNFNSVLIGIGLMTTYTVVLLQFKIDEVQQKGSFSNTTSLNGGG